MRWNGFRGSLGFAAVAALGLVPFTALVAPAVGWHDALAFYAVGATAAYLVGLAPSLRQGLTAALLATGVAAGIGLFAPSWRDVVAGGALALALCRSGLLYQSRFGRALVLESLVGLGSLALAAHLYAGTLFSAVLAVWAFFLVQSAFFLVGGVAPRPDAAPSEDPFEAARARALELLGHGGVGEP